MYIVIINHNFNQETKVFDFKSCMISWAEKNGYTLVQTDVAHIFKAEF